MLSYKVLCVGSATVDRFLTVNCPLSKIKLGDKVLVNSEEIHSGGGATNSAAALSRLGIKTRVFTKLGNDPAADLVLKELKQYKVRTICLHRSCKSTDSATIISSKKERDRIIFVNKGASTDLSIADCRKRNLKTSWIYLASLMGKSFRTARIIVAYAKRKKVNILFNPSLYLANKGQKFLGSILQATSVLVLNKEEAQALLKTKNNSETELLLKLHRLGPETVVITNGDKRLFAYRENFVYSLKPPEVKIVHTAGAGDAFTAGLLAGMIKKFSFEDCLRLGQVNASSVIQHLGTKNKLLTLKEAKSILKYKKIKVNKKKID